MDFSCDFYCVECSLISVSGSRVHKQIIKCLCRIGRKSKLHTFGAWQPPAYSGGVQPLEDEYNPQIDLVWFLDLRESLKGGFDKICKIIHRWTDGAIPEDSLRYIPLAAFEVETSDPTSKTIYSDLHNLAATRAPFKFEVIREIGEMNLDRAKRIESAAKTFDGITDCFVISDENLSELELQIEKRVYHLPPCKLRKRKAKPDDFRSQILSTGQKCGLISQIEFTPPQCRQKNIYPPMLDGAWLVSIPREASIALHNLIQLSLCEPLHDLCHYTIFGFEHEKETSQKHVAGGISNLSRHSYIGFLVVPTEKLNNAKKLISKYSIAFGMTNVFVVSESSIS